MARPAIPEGEKDVDALRKHGFWSVCNPFEAGKWEDRYSEALKEANTIIVPDNDYGTPSLIL
jgi:hypothetical protein